MNDLNLPKAFEEFLRAGLQLSYDFQRAEAGKVVLLPLNALRLAEFRVQTWGKEQHRNDPNRKRRGHYSVRGICLVEGCDGYDPIGILVWFPDEDAFGSWDSDHNDIWLFPEVTWSEIAADPLPYLNAQRHPGNVELEWLVPWSRYPFYDDPEPEFGARRMDPRPVMPPTQLSLFPDDQL